MFPPPCSLVSQPLGQAPEPCLPAGCPWEALVGRVAGAKPAGRDKLGPKDRGRLRLSSGSPPIPGGPGDTVGTSVWGGHTDHAPSALPAVRLSPSLHLSLSLSPFGLSGIPLWLSASLPP